MQLNYINKLLGLKEVIVENICNFEGSLVITLSLPKAVHICPCCGSTTSRVHDYRFHTIRDLSFQVKYTVIKYKKRRYFCKTCSKRFYEKNSFVSRYQRFTKRLLAHVLLELKTTHSYKDIARRFNFSPNTLSRITDSLCYNPTTLPTVLSIDEFRGNAGNKKYQCIIVDPASRKIFDIVKDRKYDVLDEYFKQFSNKDNVKFIVIDMWKPYKNIAKKHFKDATIVIDKFHYVRNCIWAMDKLRKRIQKELPKSEMKFFKSCRKLLLSHPDKLSNHNKILLSEVLSRNEMIRKAYHLKESFRVFVNAKTYEDAKIILNSWLQLAKQYKIDEFNYFAKTITNWKEEILNSFKTKYTNGVAEGFNNKIKVIKRNAYGVRNFHRFRNRILHCTR